MANLSKRPLSLGVFLKIKERAFILHNCVFTASVSSSVKVTTCNTFFPLDQTLVSKQQIVECSGGEPSALCRSEVSTSLRVCTGDIS